MLLALQKVCLYNMELINKFASFYTDLDSMKIEELKTIYCQNVVFIDPIGEHQGITAVEQYFNGLLKKAQNCTFTIHEQLETTDDKYIVKWTMTYTTSRMNKGKPINVDGMTLLKLKDNKIVFHRDYFDMGEMIYEHIPVLGLFIRKIKKAMTS